MKKIFFAAVIFSVLFFSVALASEELRLSSVLPVANVLRGTRGAVGTNYFSRANLPDGSIEEGHFYAERGIDIGTMHDNADPTHGNYINHALGGSIVRIGQWGSNYGEGTTSGVIGSISIGTDTIHSFEHLYLAITQNLVWRGNPSHVYRISQGPGSFMLLGRTWGPSDVAGLYFQIAPVGTAGSPADQRCEVLRIMSKKTEIWTFANGSFVRGSGSGLWVDNIRVAAPSDISLKKDISNMPNVLDRIDTIRGVNFKWKDESDASTQAGVIAQEVERSFPELVRTNPAGIKYVSYEGLTGALVEAVKELKKENEALKAKNKSMYDAAERLRERNNLFREQIGMLKKHKKGKS